MPVPVVQQRPKAQLRLSCAIRVSLVSCKQGQLYLKSITGTPHEPERSASKPYWEVTHIRPELLKREKAPSQNRKHKYEHLEPYVLEARRL